MEKSKTAKTAPKYEITIGIECHVQLATKTKLFSEVDNDARGKEPNSCVSPVDYALPGMLPRLNQAAVQLAVRAGKALNATVNPESRFDRKHYYYPDLPKGYQISQFYQPIIGAGLIELPSGRQIRIEHAHLEEDAGKLSHGHGYSLVDLNRAGTPLLEIVSMPDIHSAKEAHDYCKELWRAMVFAGVTLGDLYNGNMRFDVNISLALPGAKELGTRAEIKNLNSFHSVEKAVEFEYKRQSKLLDAGQRVKQETRGYNDATGETTPQRSKEEAQDYRYMPEPDVAPIRLSPEFIASEFATVPPLPRDYRRLLSGVLPSDTLEVLLDYPQLMQALTSILGDWQPKPTTAAGAETLTADPPKVSATQASQLQRIANLFASVLLAEENASLLNDPMPSADQLIQLATMLEKGELSSTAGKQVFLKFFDPDMHFKDTRTIAKELNVLQENDLGAIETFVDTVIADPANAQAIADFQAGSDKVIGFLVGQVMKASRGKANPASAQQLLRQKLQK